MARDQTQDYFSLNSSCICEVFCGFQRWNLAHIFIPVRDKNLKRTVWVISMINIKLIPDHSLCRDNWLLSHLKKYLAIFLVTLLKCLPVFRSAVCTSAISESQNSWGWKEPLEVILSNPFNLPAQAGPPRAGCPGPCPDSFWISPRMDTPQPLWVAYASARSPSQQKPVSWCSEGTSVTEGP